MLIRRIVLGALLTVSSLGYAQDTGDILEEEFGDLNDTGGLYEDFDPEPPDRDGDGEADDVDSHPDDPYNGNPPSTDGPWEEYDGDGDGIPDVDDPWPFDPSRPVVFETLPEVEEPELDDEVWVVPVDLDDLDPWMIPDIEFDDLWPEGL
jgi:hypothetical protein